MSSKPEIDKLFVIKCRSNQEAHTAPACYEEAKALEFAKKADAGASCPNTDHQVEMSKMEALYYTLLKGK